MVLRKKIMPPRLAMETVSTWAQTTRILSASEAAYEQAWKLATSHQYQVWGALIVACVPSMVSKSYILKTRDR